MRRLRIGITGFLIGLAWAPAQDFRGERRVHLETSFDVMVHAPVAEALKLFTPEGERTWAGKHWNPQYVYPAGPMRDAEGAVFTIQHGLSQVVWAVMQRDDVARKFAYAYFVPDLMITIIRVRFETVNAGATNVHITYERTALSPAGEAYVAAMSKQDARGGAEWQSAIAKYLAEKSAQAR